MIFQAPTGTGKTGAFVGAILCSVDTSKPHVQALMLAPQRFVAEMYVFFFFFFFFFVCLTDRVGLGSVCLFCFCLWFACACVATAAHVNGYDRNSHPHMCML